jgi:hypothetical protein
VDDRERDERQADMAGTREEELKRKRARIGGEHEGNRADADAGAPEADQREARNR